MRRILLFIVITLLLHYGWRNTDVVRKNNVTDYLNPRLQDLLLVHSSFFLIPILPHYTENSTLYFTSGTYISISAGCSGLKQMYQLLGLFLLMPGKLTNKLQLIPIGIALMHFTNIVRIVFLAIVLHWDADYWKLAHDYIARPFFYGVIFLLWIYFEIKNKTQ